MRPSFIQGLRSRPRLSLATLGAGILFAASIAVSPAAAAGRSTCADVLGSGTYHSLTVTGFCTVPNGSNVVIKGGLTIAPGAAFLATSFLDGKCDRSVTVSGGIQVGDGATLILGDSAIGTGCAGAKTVIRVASVVMARSPSSSTAPPSTADSR